jgi:hypothetical protein
MFNTVHSPNFRSVNLNSADNQWLVGHFQIQAPQFWADSGGDRHLLEDGRQGDADGAADRIDGRAGSGAQAGAAAVLFDVDLAEIGEVVDDALPFERAATSRETIHQLLAQGPAYSGPNG